MSDITICVNNRCKQKDTCYRALAEWNEYRQSICEFNEVDCKYYWHIKKETNDNKNGSC